MKNFFETAQRVTTSESEVGLYLVEIVLKIRTDNSKAYHKGQGKDFRNKEMNRILTGLERLVENGPAIPTLEEIEKEHQKQLEKYRDIERICFVYDAVKFIYQQSHGNLEATTEFIGKQFLSNARTERDRGREKAANASVKSEYVHILNNLKNALNKEYRVILKSGF